MNSRFFRILLGKGDDFNWRKQSVFLSAIDGGWKTNLCSSLFSLTTPKACELQGKTLQEFLDEYKPNNLTQYLDA